LPVTHSGGEPLKAHLFSARVGGPDEKSSQEYFFTPVYLRCMRKAYAPDFWDLRA
jgi:hypothetical protein